VHGRVFRRLLIIENVGADPPLSLIIGSELARKRQKISDSHIARLNAYGNRY
jgi:hypothetical protein